MRDPPTKDFTISLGYCIKGDHIYEITIER